MKVTLVETRHYPISNVKTVPPNISERLTEPWFIGGLCLSLILASSQTLFALLTLFSAAPNESRVACLVGSADYVLGGFSADSNHIRWVCIHNSVSKNSRHRASLTSTTAFRISKEEEPIPTINLHRCGRIYTDSTALELD